MGGTSEGREEGGGEYRHEGMHQTAMGGDGRREYVRWDIRVVGIFLSRSGEKGRRSVGKKEKGFEGEECRTRSVCWHVRVDY